MSKRVLVDFTLKDVKQENLPEQIVYCVKFCERYASLWSYFAAVGSNTISIYCITNDEVHLVRHYVDETLRRTSVTSSDHSDAAEGNDMDNFYACTWASSGVNEPVVVVGGRKGIIKIVSTQSSHEGGFLHGHGGDIHELKTHPLDDGLVLSASKDLSVRMWNIRSLVCVSIFGGEQGHRRDVLSLDIHALGNCMVSSSLDSSIKIWSLNSPRLLDAIKRSDEPQPGLVEFRPLIEQIPLFSSFQIHSGYVDSVKWVGDFVLSKSTNNRIVLWMPDPIRHKVFLRIIFAF
jgi:polycomb protein EED